MFYLCVGPVDEDVQREHVSQEHRSKSSPKFSGHKKNCGQVKYTFFKPPPPLSPCFVDPLASLSWTIIRELSMQLPLNKRKSQGHGGKRKPSMNNERADATDPEESDYKSLLPSRFSKR